MAKYDKTVFMAPFWWIAGCEVDLLKQDDCRTDRQKYAAIGAVILMTSLIALVAGFSAAWWFTQTTANPHGDKFLSLFFGIFWALFIFCVDRSLVITLRKCKDDKWYKFIGPFVLRAVLAVFIAGMISIPLELMVFKGSIVQWQSKLNDMGLKQKKVDAEEIWGGVSENDIIRLENVKEDAKTDLDGLIRHKVAMEKSLDSLQKTTVSNYSSYITAKNDIERYDKQLKEKRLKKDERERLIKAKSDSERKKDNAESQFNSDKTKKIQTKQKEIVIVSGQINDAKAAYNMAKSDYESNLKIKAEQNTKINQEVSSHEKVTQDANLFLEYYKALSWGVNQEGSSQEKILLWMIRIMFWLFEIMPTMVKLMTNAGAYDRKLQLMEAHNIEYFESDDFKKHIMNLRNHDKSLQNTIIEKRNKYRIDLEQSISEKLRDANLELADRIITKWKIEEENNL